MVLRVLVEWLLQRNDLIREHGKGILHVTHSFKGSPVSGRDSRPRLHREAELRPETLHDLVSGTKRLDVRIL